MQSNIRTVSLKRKAAGAAERHGPQSVGRILTILDFLADNRGGATLSELAARTGAPKSSLVGLLAGLSEEGCVARDQAGRYALAPRFVSLAMRVAAGRELITLARPLMARLVAATGETAVLGALAPDADVAVYLDKVESRNPIRYAVTVGERRELYCTAIGKVLLAHFEPARLTQYLATARLERFTATTITGARRLREELKRIRRDGIARTADERFPGASGIAAPIFAPSGAVTAALLIAGPSDRMRSHAAGIERLVRAATAECTRLAGGAAAPASAKGDAMIKASTAEAGER